MAQPTNDDVTWYVCTRKDSGGHFVLNENYVSNYENEFERIREFDSLEEANMALSARVEADVVLAPKSEKTKLKVAKIRGDIRKGSVDDEKTRATIRAEIEAEMKAEGISLKPPSSATAKVGPKTTARAGARKTTK